ncbi:MAG: hypothetical protein ACO3EE_12110, partial [Flavobacteriales bacterium]
MKHILFALLLIIAFNSKSQVQPITPSYQDMVGIGYARSSNGFHAKVFYEVLFLKSLSGGLGVKFYSNRTFSFETSFHYDVLRNVSLAKAGFHFNHKILHFAAEYAYVNNFHHGLSYMPVYFGIGNRQKWSICYVRNFVLERGNEFHYPL